MSQITTPDGIEYIYEAKDFADVIRKYISDDAATLYLKQAEFADSEEILAEKKFNSDFSAMEGEVEAYRDMLFEAKELIEKLLVYMDDAKRLNRQYVYTELNKVWTEIQRNL